MKITMGDFKTAIVEAVKEVIAVPAKKAELGNEIADKLPGQSVDKVLSAGLFYAKVFGFQKTDGSVIKALTDDIMYTGNNAQGGYINAPAETAAEIFRIMKDNSVVASRAEFRSQVPDVTKVTTDTSSLTVTYTSEAAAKTKTKPTLTQTELTLRKPALQIILSDEEMQGSLVDIVVYLNSKIGEEFGQDLDYRVLGVNAATPYDSIPHVSGTNAVTLASADAAGLTYAKFVAATCAIVSNAVSGAEFFMHRTVVGDVLSIVDGVGRPMFQADPTGQRFGTILGFPVVPVEKMPTTAQYASAAVPILFGNLKYWRVGVKHDLQVKVSGDVAVTLDGQLVSCWENNLTAIRAEARRSGALLVPSTFAKFVMP